MPWNKDAPDQSATVTEDALAAAPAEPLIQTPAPAPMPAALAGTPESAQAAAPASSPAPTPSPTPSPPPGPSPAPAPSPVPAPAPAPAPPPAPTSQPASAAPPWAYKVQADDTWVLVSEQSFNDWARASLDNPAPGFKGTNWIQAIVTSFGSPAFHEAGREAYLFGGGHSAGSFNGVIKTDLNALHLRPYSLAVRPTPASAYPPSYANNINNPGGVVYPSKINEPVAPVATRSYRTTFLANLTDPADVAYSAPEDAPVASHAYGNFEYQVIGGAPTLSLDYLAVANANLNTGRWVYANGDRHATQLAALGLGNYPLQQGTKSHFDAATGQRFVTCTPGDAGVNSRNHILRIDAATNRIVQAHRIPDWFLSNAVSICAVDRKLWVFPRSGTYGAGFTGNTAMTFDMDTHQVVYYTIAGAPIQYPDGLFQESVPCSHVGGSTIARWSHGAERNAMYLLYTTPNGGAGTSTSPHVITQVKRTLSGMPSNPFWQHRLMYVHAWRMFVVHHGPLTGWYALRLGPV